MSELRARFAPGADVREIEIYLASRGYDAQQIGEIVAGLAPHLADDGATPLAAGAPGPAVPSRPEGPAFRIMSTYERSRFSPEAWGHLLALGAAGVIGPAEREHVIERALMGTDGRIGLDELRALLQGAGVGDPSSGGPTTIH